jgi:hypothetical protein
VSRATKVVAALLVVMATSPVWGFELLYHYGLWRRGSVPPPPATTLSSRELDALWAVEEGATSVRLLWVGNFFEMRPPRDGVGTVARLAPGDAERGRHPGFSLTEVAYAVWLSRHASHQELVAALAEWSWFGHGAISLEQAAQVYFGKSASALTTGELALLSGLLQSPVQYDPVCRPERALKRRAYALKRLEAEGLIDSSARVAAEQEPISVLPRCRAPSPRTAGEFEEP